MPSSTVFVVTAPQLRETGEMSFKFTAQPGVPDYVMGCDSWGLVTLHPKDANYVDPFKFARNEPDAVGDDGIKRWGLHVFSARGMVFSANVNENPPGEEGLRKILNRMEEAANTSLLMSRDVFDRFETACKAEGIELRVHHHPEPLSTS